MKNVAGLESWMSFHQSLKRLGIKPPSQLATIQVGLPTPKQQAHPHTPLYNTRMTGMNGLQFGFTVYDLDTPDIRRVDMPGLLKISDLPSEDRVVKSLADFLRLIHPLVISGTLPVQDRFLRVEKDGQGQCAEAARAIHSLWSENEGG